MSSTISQPLSPVTNDDLLTEILLRLPAKSLARFKSVSKRWLSLISDPQLLRRRSSSASSLYLTRYRVHKQSLRQEVARVDITYSVPSFQSTTFTKCGPSGVKIVQSCNGLLLCSNAVFEAKMDDIYYVYNPTTKHCAALPNPSYSGGDRIYGVALAFDPSVSPHYRVICVINFNIFVYSSDSGLWRSTRASLADGDFDPLCFYQGTVYCNGSVHWMGSSRRSAPYFHFASEKIRYFPMPNLTPRDPTQRDFRYFGASRDRLHAVDHIRKTVDTHFSIFELEKDYSKWVVKYRVNISETQRAFPEIIHSRACRLWGRRHYYLSVICVVRCEIEEDSFLVMSIPGKIARYNFKTGTIRQLSIDPNFMDVEIDGAIFGPRDVYEYVESLACV